MGLKDLFRKKTSVAKPNPSISSTESILSAVHEKYDNQLSNVENSFHRLTDNELLVIFAEYFAPNTDFYDPGNSDKYKAYFGVINGAIPEMLNNPQLFRQATKRDPAELLSMCNNRVPGLTNNLLCGLIFIMGKFAMVPSAILCVDFAEAIPNCIAIYLLLTAQKLPSENRTTMIDAGDGVDKNPLIKAMNTLSVCDLNWKYKIY